MSAECGDHSLQLYSHKNTPPPLAGNSHNRLSSFSRCPSLSLREKYDLKIMMDHEFLIQSYHSNQACVVACNVSSSLYNSYSTV